LINYYDQVKTQKTEFQEELHSQVYQNTLKRVDRSFQNFSIKDDKLTLSKIGSIKIILHKTKTGIDVGLTSLITFSNGQQIEPPKYLRVSEKRLAREQIHLSKKKKRSMNRNKQRVIVTKVHRKIRNQRKDITDLYMWSSRPKNTFSQNT
jgi:putative transposase